MATQVEISMTTAKVEPMVRCSKCLQLWKRDVMLLDGTCYYCYVRQHEEPPPKGCFCSPLECACDKPPS